MSRTLACLLLAAMLIGCTEKPAAPTDPPKKTPTTQPAPPTDVKPTDVKPTDVKPTETDPPEGEPIIEPLDTDPPAAKPEVKQPPATVDPPGIARLGDPAQRDAAVAEYVAQGEAAAPELIQALESGDPQVRAGAAFALSRLGPKAKSALPALEQVSKSDPDDVARSAADFAIIAISGKE
ncbi:HEAT repeat domain-containing protein [Lignipirellula cremea]|uniref:HEAT repeat protein n=1 Tax=Lignipirellula cremea TaxID=2528010 RepID=A0A518DPJ5_9BACT|nr:HEAT repeat domain-containing protein [Lignipirellula cremea]QDU93761.1 hypothetical protein Pla8534_15440 [Lignipirellula cremea]